MRTSIGLCISAISFPLFAYAAALVNINTADATLLDTLPGIGAVKAQAIIDYRNANGPFATIEDIQNVSGIGPSTYAQIAPLITVGDSGSSNESTNQTASSTAPSTSSTGTSGSSTYVPPPSVITLDTDVNPHATLEVPTHFSAHAITKSGAIDPTAHLAWSFGDGSATEGTYVEKTYRYAGTYLMRITATDGSAVAQKDVTISADPAAVRIAAISGEGITIANDARDQLDLSGWRLSAGISLFRIPDGTILLPEASVLFPSNITNLPIMLDDVSLAYPDGIVAARYAPPASVQEAVEVQPSALVASSSLVQAVEPITSANTNIQAHEETVNAPATTTELAVAGAALASSQADPAPSQASGVFHSPWTLGLLGVVVLAGGAFILL